MNSSKEMTIILDRAYSILDKNDKLKIKKIITEINKPMKAPNNFPQLIRSAIKETAKVQKIKISQEKYYDKFLYNLDNSIEFISKNDFKPMSPTWVKYNQKMFSNTQLHISDDNTIENYYYPNFDENKDKDFISFNSYKKYLSGEKRPSIVRMRNMLKFFEDTANKDDPRKYEDEFYDLNYLKNYIHFSYHETLFHDINQEINYIFQIIIDSLNGLHDMNKVISKLIPSTENGLNENIEWIKSFSKFNNIALTKLDFAQKALYLEKIKLSDLPKINLTNSTAFLKIIHHYIVSAQSPFYNNLFTGEPAQTIIGNYIDNYFLEKYYDISSPSWIPVQLNEANFIYIISTKAILDFLHNMPYRIKATNNLLNTPGFNFKK